MSKEYDDEPPVMGAGCGPAPMPTQADRRAAWGRQFVIVAVELGVLEKDHAEELFQAGISDWDYDLSPEEALHQELTYWDNDGDLA